MAHTFSLAHLTVLGWTPPELIYNAKMLGYDHASIRTISMGVSRESDFSLEHNPALFELTQEALHETGLTLHDIELAKIDDNTNARTFEGAFAAAQKLGARGVISSIWTEREAHALEQFALVCDLAANYGLTVHLEFPSWAAVWNLEGVRQMLDKVNRPNAAILLDTLHVHRSGVTLDEIRTCPKEWLTFAHICDGPLPAPARSDTAALIHTGRDARLYVGEGGIDIAGIVGCLHENAVLSIELPHVERAARYGAAEHARRCLVTARDYLRQHGIALGGAKEPRS